MNTNTFTNLCVFQRASTATYYDSNGTLQTAATNVPRFDYDPVTLAPLGLLTERSRTNYDTYNNMGGAVAGSPGTLPTTWIKSGFASLTQTVVGTGIANGIDYIDVRIQGTTSDTVGAWLFQNTTTAAATNNQTWAMSAYIQVVGGSMTNLTMRQYLYMYDSGSTYLSAVQGANVTLPGLSSLAACRITQVSTTNHASTAYVRHGLDLLYNSGVEIDVTLRIGKPQMELGTSVTSVIPTTSAAVTRAADTVYLSNHMSWFNPQEGTLLVEAKTGGATTPTVSETVVIIQGSSTNDRIEIVRPVGSNIVQPVVITGGTGQSTPSGTAVNTYTSFKAGYAWSIGGSSFSMNGAPVNTTGSMTLPVVSSIGIGCRPDATSQFMGWIRAIRYIPKKIADADLQLATA